MQPALSFLCFALRQPHSSLQGSNILRQGGAITVEGERNSQRLIFFYTQLMEQKYVALSSTKDKVAISLRGKTRNIGSDKLNEIFEKNTYLQSIYPNVTRKALEVFQIYEAQGEYFDISDPAHIVRENIVIGDTKAIQSGYFIKKNCIGCGACYESCPQKCIDMSCIPAQIDQNHCLHCGQCSEVCPARAIEKRETL